jgi:hypothetical protein
MRHKSIFGFLALVVILSFGYQWHDYVQAQELITATPVRVVIPTSAPIITGPEFTPTFTRTPTVSGPVLLEAKEDAGDVNVRADADIEAERIGSIRAGDTYPVLGRRFRWYQFQFDQSPNGRGWVFDELVTIIGDESAIRDFSLEEMPTQDTVALAATQTQEAVTLTPGGLLTATVIARDGGVVLIDPNLSGSFSTGEDLSLVEVLPTYTYPPNIVAAQPTEDSLFTVTPTPAPVAPLIPLPSGIPPIAPIMILGGVGLLGLALNSLRR